MKKFIVIIAIGLVLFGLGATLAGCGSEHDEAVHEPEPLAIPTNVNVAVEGRMATVTWDAVPGAVGYIVYTTSTDCGSGNRIINTATKTVTNHEGAETEGAVSEFAVASRGNGFVTFLDETTITIWLMAESMDSEHENIPMPTAVSAKVLAIFESGYSQAVEIEKGDYSPAPPDQYAKFC